MRTEKKYKHKCHNWQTKLVGIIKKLFKDLISVVKAAEYSKNEVKDEVHTYFKTTIGHGKNP